MEHSLLLKYIDLYYRPDHGDHAACEKHLITHLLGREASYTLLLEGQDLH